MGSSLKVRTGVVDGGVNVESGHVDGKLGSVGVNESFRGDEDKFRDGDGREVDGKRVHPVVALENGVCKGKGSKVSVASRMSEQPMNGPRTVMWPETPSAYPFLPQNRKAAARCLRDRGVERSANNEGCPHLDGLRRPARGRLTP